MLTEEAREGGRGGEGRRAEASNHLGKTLPGTILPSISTTNSLLKQLCQHIIRQKEEQNREIVTGKCTMNITNTGGAVWVWSRVGMEGNTPGTIKGNGSKQIVSLCREL